MGVKGFNTWFGKTFPQAYVPVKRQVDHLYLDMASFLHEELRKGAAVPLLHHTKACTPSFPRHILLIGLHAGMRMTVGCTLPVHKNIINSTACATERLAQIG